MSTSAQRQQLAAASAALQADPTQAQRWVDYVQALVDSGQVAEARKTVEVAARKGLDESVLHQLMHQAPSSPRQRTEPHYSSPALPSIVKPPQQDVDHLALLFQMSRFVELMPLAERMTVQFPDFPFGWSVCGAALVAQGKPQEALEPSRRASILAPNDASVHSNLGGALNEVGLFDEALRCFQRALDLAPQSAEVRFNLAKALHDLGRLEEARTHYEQVIRIDPKIVASYCNLGKVLSDLDSHTESIRCYEDALAIDPSEAAAYFGLGAVLFSLKRVDEAEKHFRYATKLRPDNADAHYNLAVTLDSLNRSEEACASYRNAIRLRPTYHDARYNMGNALRDLGRFAEAAHAYEQVIQADPNYAAALINRAKALDSQGRLDEAVSNYRKAMRLDPSDATAHNGLLFALNYHPDKPPEEIYQAYEAYEGQFGAPLRAQWQPHRNAPLISPAGTPRRLRIGYVSPDLRQHSVRHFLEPLLASHDHSRFEVFCYAELAREDAATARYRTCCDHFILTRGMSDEALACRIRADAIDVLIDVAGHTAGNRLLVFARKPAPVSLSWLGYGYTTGLKAIDYLLTDEASAPVGSEHLFSETPWRLSSTPYVYRPDPAMGEVSPLAALSNGFVTFGTLTRAIRINHRTVRVWSEILKRVPHSRLVIDSQNFQHASMQEMMAQRFTDAGIERQRLLIGCHSPPWDTLRAMDIGLDCFPHNSGTTLFESLYMGVPYVTLAGRPSVGRLGQSILSGLNQPHWLDAWCAASEQDYIDKAVALASDLPSLALIRARLRPAMQASSLMDEPGFATRVEQAYLQMFERWQHSHAQAATQAAQVQGYRA